jgi:hypothetical protein
MRTKSSTPRSTIRQTLYPVIRARRRRYVGNAQPDTRALTEYPVRSTEKARAP